MFVLVIIAYTQKPRENVDADKHVSVIEVSILQLFIIYIHSLLWRACTITQTFADNAISTKRLRIG